MWKAIFLVFAAVSAQSFRMTGGLEDVELNKDEDARSALDFAVVQHNRRSNDMYLSNWTEVVKVQRQVSSRP